MEKNLIKGHLATAGANVMWGLMAPVVKSVMIVGLVSPMLMAGMRIFGAALLFWLLSLMMPREKVAPRDLLYLAGAGMLGIVFNQGCYVFGVSLTSPGEAAIITTTMPLWVMALAAALLGEPVTMKKIGGILLGATGALILVAGSLQSSAGGDNPMLGDMLVFGAQLSYALYLTFYRNFIRKYSVVTLMKWMFLFSALATMPFVIPEALRTPWQQLSGIEIAGSVYVVVCGTFLAYICVMIGQKHLRPTLVGMYNYVQPIVATIVGVCLGMDRLTPMKFLAVAFIFSGVFMVNISKAKAQNQ